ncbi:MAG: protein kinase [Isosphaeraceae bacterium]
MAPSDCPPPDRWRHHLAGDLPETEQAELAAHLGGCPACQQTLQGLASDSSLLDAAVAAGQDTLSLGPALGRVLKELKKPGPSAAASWSTTQGPGGGATLDPTPLPYLDPPARADAIGRIQQYDVLERIGAGGMGIVYRAWDSELQRIVAIKFLKPELAASGLARQRFQREAQKQAAVSHDHVVMILAVGEGGGGFPFLVMEFVTGCSLEKRLQQSGLLGLERVLRIGMQAARGLAAAHAQGLIHRDIKPANLLLENHIERVKIADFGLAKAAEGDDLTMVGCLAGTPQYMSPQQADGQPLDHRSDLFSLGSVLYVMATGRKPFNGATTTAVLQAVSRAQPRPPRDWNPQVPEGLARVIEKLHAHDPDKRYQSATEVGDALEALLADEQIPSGERVRRRSRRWARPWARSLGVLGALAMLALVGLAAARLWPANGRATADPPAEESPRKPAKFLTPAELARMKPTIDWDLRWTGHAPPEPGESDGKFNFEYYFTKECEVMEFKPLPGNGWRCSRRATNEILRNFACRLGGRADGGDHAAISMILLGQPPIAVHARADGVLEVSQIRWASTDSLTFPRTRRSWKDVARPVGEENDLLVIVQDGRLRVFVNDQPIGEPIELPEHTVPCEPQRAGFCWGGGEARIELTHFTVWDLDHPEPVTPAAAALKLPADLERLVPALADQEGPGIGGFGVGSGDPKLERTYVQGVGFVDHYLEGHDFNRTYRIRDLVVREFAARLTGRVESEGRAAMSIWIAGPSRQGQCFGVHLWNDGSVEVGKSVYGGSILALPPRPCQDAMRPAEQPNELLVVIRDKSLRIFVNDREIGPPVGLPEELKRMDVGTGSLIETPGEAKITLADFKLWDLEHPVWKGPMREPGGSKRGDAPGATSPPE